MTQATAVNGEEAAAVEAAGIDMLGLLSTRVMHQHVTHNRAYPTQKLFTEAILKFFRKIVPEQWHNFQNQVTDNFRIISDQNLRVLE